MEETIYSFCYALLLHCKERTKDILALLTPEKRSKVEEVLRELRDCSECDLQERWQEMRHSGQRTQAQAAMQRTGLPLDRLAAVVRHHLAQSF